MNRNLFRHKILGLLVVEYQKVNKDNALSSSHLNVTKFTIPLSELTRKLKVTEEYLRLSCIVLVKNDDVAYAYIADGIVGTEGMYIWTNGPQDYVDRVYIKRFWNPFWKALDKILERVIPLIAVAISVVALLISKESYKLNREQMIQVQKKVKDKQLLPQQLDARQIYLYPMDSGKSSK